MALDDHQVISGPKVFHNLIYLFDMIGYLSGNAIRKIKETVEKDLNVKFDLRMCRRTFSQRYLDKMSTLSRYRP